jgi:hypothetical protein
MLDLILVSNLSGDINIGIKDANLLREGKKDIDLKIFPAWTGHWAGCNYSAGCRLQTGLLQLTMRSLHI